MENKIDKNRLLRWDDKSIMFDAFAADFFGNNDFALDSSYTRAIGFIKRPDFDKDIVITLTNLGNRCEIRSDTDSAYWKDVLEDIVGEWNESLAADEQSYRWCYIDGPEESQVFMCGVSVA